MENLPTYRLTQSGPEAQEILDQVNLNTIDIEQLKRLYQALNQSEPEIIEPNDTWPVVNPEENVIYRVIDRVNTPPQYYSDYMWNGTSMVLMGQYNNAIDNEPTANSNNLVKSGGVYSFVHANGGAYDISAAHAVGGVLATYDDLADALGTNGANVPSGVRKGGMSIKFVLSSDNKYVRFNYLLEDATTNSKFANVANWERYNDVITSNQLFSDLDFSDEQENVLVRFRNGHIKTKNFNSSEDATDTKRGLMSANDKAKLNSIEQGAEVNDVTVGDVDSSDLEFTDENDNVLARFKDGHFRTKNFNSEKFAIIDNVPTTNSPYPISSGGVKNALDAISPSPSELTILTPKTIYTVCNDIDVSDSCANPWIAEDDSIINARQYCQKIRIDHFFSFLTKKPDMSIDGSGQRFIVFDSILSPSTISSYKNIINVNSDSYTSTVKKQDLNIQTVPFVLKGNGYENKSFNIKHISVRNKATENKHVRLLCIGDSVTAGSYGNVNKPYRNAPGNYWSWVKCLFELDNLQNNGGFDCVMLGNHLRSASYGRKYNETFDINFHSLTKSNVKVSACGDGGKTTSFWISDNASEFYDRTNNKFSVKYWVDNYRTLDVNADGSVSEAVTKGSKAVGSYLDGLVCEPTHVLIQLGFNESYNTEGTTRTTYLANLQTMINSIRLEYPNAYILLSLPDCAGTYYPEDYPNYTGMSGSYNFRLDMSKDACKTWHDRFAFMNKDLMDLEDTDNNIFYVPSYFASPCCDQAPCRESNEAIYLSSQYESAKHYSMIGWVPYQHPNNAGHLSWAYQIYSLIKYTLLLN